MRVRDIESGTTCDHLASNALNGCFDWSKFSKIQSDAHFAHRFQSKFGFWETHIPWNAIFCIPWKFRFAYACHVPHSISILRIHSTLHVSCFMFRWCNFTFDIILFFICLYLPCRARRGFPQSGSCPTAPARLANTPLPATYACRLSELHTLFEL